jgi:hypothetical protein
MTNRVPRIAAMTFAELYEAQRKLRHPRKGQRLATACVIARQRRKDQATKRRGHAKFGA